MKLFIASHSQKKARLLKGILEGDGHQVLARWITEDSKFASGQGAYTDKERSDLAVMDEADVRSAEGLVVIAEESGRTVPGGKHVETGMALALRKPVFVLGERENIFHWHPMVASCPTQDDLLAKLGEFSQLLNSTIHY